MLLPLLFQNLQPAISTGDLDFTVVETVRDYRLEGAAIVIDGVLAGFTRPIGVFRMNAITAGSHSLQISADGYNSLTGTFNITAGFTTVGYFRLIPFVNRFLRDPAATRVKEYAGNPDIQRYGHIDW